MIANDVLVPVFNSYTGDLIANVPQSTKQDVENALNSAEKAVKIGRSMSAAKRSGILRKAVLIMERDYEELVNLIATEGVKIITHARKEVTRAINTMQLSSEEALRIKGATIPFDSVEGSEDRVGYEYKVPIGIVVAITPFNDPLNLVCHKLGPAIAAGNPVILKPSDFTPLIALKLGEILKEAGLPDGMLNIITGNPEVFGNSLISDERVQLISFTGGVEAAKAIQKMAGLQKISMELGSNSPVIVMSDADLDDAIDSCVFGAFFASGQNCVGVKRIFVQKNVYKIFLDRFVKRTRKLKIGSPLSDDTEIGPIVSSAAIAKIQKYVDESCLNGASLLIGGQSKGNTYCPTVLTDECDNNMSNLNEVFGPVVTICEIENLDQAIACANKSPFGIHTAIFTNDINTAHIAIKELHCGGIIINDSTDYRIDAMPFGGVKLSGFGREGIPSSIDTMMVTKIVCFKIKK